MNKNEAIKAVVDGADSDAIYDQFCPQHNTPGAFALRFVRKKLTKDEQAKVKDVKDPAEAFAACYPDYIGRQKFRDAVAAAQTSEKKKTAAPKATPTPKD